MGLRGGKGSQGDKGSSTEDGNRGHNFSFTPTGQWLWARSVAKVSATMLVTAPETIPACLPQLPATREGTELEDLQAPSALTLGHSVGRTSMHCRLTVHGALDATQS